MADKTDNSGNEQERSAAEDFRRQLQERSTQVGPSLTRTDILRWFDENSEWLERTISVSWGESDAHLQSEFREKLEMVPLVTSHDEPFTHSIMQTLCQEIETACGSLGIPLRSGVAYGADPSLGIDASCVGVQLTDASVISLSRGLIAFCSHISKMFAMSLPHELGPESNEFRVCFERSRVFGKIASDPELRLYWTKVFGFYAFGPGPFTIRQVIVPHPASVTRLQLLYAMERFAVAHEYAHHIAAHGKRDALLAGADDIGKMEEYEADLFALSLSRFLGCSDTPQNIYSMSGAAAVALLKCSECVKRARRILLRGDDAEPPSRTHPEAVDRIAAFAKLDPHLSDYERQAFTQIREDFANIVDTIWERLRPVYIELHRAGLKPEESQLASWLPN